MKLTVKNKIMSIGGASTVLNEEGKEVYRVKGKAFSFTNKKFVTSLDGKVLYTVRNKYFKVLVYSAFIFDENGEKIAHLKDNLTLVDNFTSVDFADTFKLIRESGVIKFYKNEEHFATMKREYFKVADTFELEVFEEVNAPIAIALTIAYDNITDRKDRDRANRRN
ncbi:MAG: LURP-one-related family protein [Clostridia bacterium]|nr:LURP-one-related family protein [Clostridia bacterium]